MKTAPLLVLAACLLTGCSRDEQVYPSLAPRAAEKLGFGEPEVPVRPVLPDPALDARITALSRTLGTVAAGFTADTTKAQAITAIAKGKAIGSDAWLAAQTALTPLADWRAQGSAMLTDVDQIASDRAAALAPPYPALTELRTRVAAETERQDETIRQLQALLPGA